MSDLKTSKKPSGVIFFIIFLILFAGGFYLYSKYNSQSFSDNSDSQNKTELSDYFSNEEIINRVDLEIPDDVRKRFEDSLLSYQELQSNENNAYQGYMGEATTYMQLGDYQTALEKLKAMVELYPDDELVYMNLGDLYIRMKQYLEAARAMHTAIEKKPEEVLPHLRLAELYEKYSKEPLRAEKIYQQALVDTNGHIEIRKAQAVFLENIKKDYRAAIAVWMQLLEGQTDEKLINSINEKISEIEKKIQE